MKTTDIPPSQKSIQEYQEKLLNQHEHQQAALHSRLMQNANVIVLTLSFVFLFEMTFIGGAFPDSPSSISIQRYWPCLCLLLVANVSLVLSMALLLTAIVRFNTPWPSRDDYLPDERIPLSVRLLGIRYAIIRAAENTMRTQERVIRAAKQFIIAGVLIGVLSALAFTLCIWGNIVDSFNSWFSIGDSEALFIIMAVSIIAGVVALVLYFKATADLKSLYAQYDAGEVGELEKHEKVAEALKAASNSDASPLAITAIATAYQNDFIAFNRYKWPIEFETLWLTVSHACNLSCPHCYMRGATNDGAMEPSILRGLLDIAAKAGVSKVVLTGGDALCYTHLGEAIREAHARNMTVTIPTSGYEFSRNSDLADGLVPLLESGDCINISLKGWDAESYEKRAGVDGYENAMDVVFSLRSKGVNVSASMVLDDKSVPHFLKAVKFAVDCGVKDFLFTPVFDPVEEGSVPLFSPKQIRNFVDKIEGCYERLCGLTNGRFAIEHTLPLCFWDREFIERLSDDRHLTGICQLHADMGLVFDSDGSYLACNAFHGYPLGKYPVDFSSYEGLCKYLTEGAVLAARRELSSPPSKKCMYCPRLEQCAGGCATRWVRAGFDAYEMCCRW